ncbi:phosphorylase [Aureimonas leprariae]|uniref:Phosphorylase n=1 Tax=Plantimonas leprariae TaxID=2615207 RepID=A0A7V7PQI7_9HYPH|nr:phosphorylase [Aureimonas leprariae]KAB0680637.1 phosphorylase [Aureimonas leprariae]
MKADGRPVLVVGGLAAEARIAAGPGVICLAAPPSALAGKLEDLAAEPCGVISFGLCGGLASSLDAGWLAVGTKALHDGRSWTCDPRLASRFIEAAANAGVNAIEGPFACAASPLLAARDKAALHERTGAVAVDTESHVAAAYAAKHDLPFAILRAVSDPAEANLPPLAVRAIGPTGRLDWRAISGELAFRPGQLLLLPGTALDTLRAMRALRRVRRLLGPRFGL